MTDLARRARPAHDVLIVGDGPAGLALGAACVEAGLDALVVGSGRAWTPTYATWVDDVNELSATSPDTSPDTYTDTFAATVAVDVITATDRRRIDREYAIFDNVLLRERLDVAPTEVGEVVGVEHDDRSSTVMASDGRRWTARIVVDATGSRPVLAESPGGPRALTVVQSAYGVIVDGRPTLHGDGLETAGILMDWRQPTGPVSVAGAGDATFLYTVPVGGGRWLVEETSLARREPMAEVDLRTRLATRADIDLHAAVLERDERVLIPMTTGVPRRIQRTVAFGAAAGYVHPATGYSVAASLRAAPRVASAIVDALAARGGSLGRETSLAVWNAVWPSEHRRARALHDYGLAAVLRMTPAEIGTFFWAFFSLPAEQQRAYLRVDTTATAVAATMQAVFSAVPWALRRRLAWGRPTAFARLLR